MVFRRHSEHAVLKTPVAGSRSAERLGLRFHGYPAERDFLTAVALHDESVAGLPDVLYLRPMRRHPAEEQVILRLQL